MWKEIPVFINNRNRLSTLTIMVDWLKKCGVKSIVIIDNQSTYPPLLTYYKNLPENVQVLKLENNLGPWAFWQLDIHKTLNSPYIVTDSDLTPPEDCPEDLIERLWHTLLINPNAGKVAPGLIIDDLPNHFSNHEIVYAWESQFWHRPFSRGLYFAPVDTTFAIYNSGSHFNNHDKNIRMGYPYVLKHNPWYVDENNISNEEDYYRSHIDLSYSFWSGNKNKIDELKLHLHNYKEADKKILHLGCGNEYIPGWINLDTSGRKLDILFNLDNCQNSKIPLQENSIDGFYASHVFEHINDTLSMMQELYRLAKNDAKFFIRIPYGSSDDAYEDPTHKHIYFENSFLYFSQPAYSKADYGYLGDWQTEKVTLIVNQKLIDAHGDSIYQIIKSQRNVVSEMIVELKAIKPSRPRLLSLLKAVDISITSDSRIYPQF